MGIHARCWFHTPSIRCLCLLVMLVGLCLGWMGCQPSGDHTLMPAPSAPTSQTEAQAIDNLLDLYSQVLRQEDTGNLLLIMQISLIPRQARRPLTATSTGFAGAFTASGRVVALSVKLHDENGVLLVAPQAELVCPLFSDPAGRIEGLVSAA